MQPRQPENRRAGLSGIASPYTEDCRFTLERLFEYVDGELSGADFAAVQAHLQSCADCAGEAALTRQAETALSSARQFAPPPGDLRSGFYARLARNERRAPATWRWKIAVPALAAAALALIFFRPTMPHGAVGPMPLRIASGNSNPHMGAAAPRPENPAPAKPLTPDVRPREPRASGGIQVAAAGKPHRRRAGAVLVASAATPERTVLRSLFGNVRVTARNLDMAASMYKSLALRTAEMPAAQPVAETVVAIAAPSSTVASVEVVDEERGFKSKMRVASNNEDQGGDQVITIKAENGGQGDTSRTQ